MTIMELGALGEFLGSTGVIVTLVYLVSCWIHSLNYDEPEIANSKAHSAGNGDSLAKGCNAAVDDLGPPEGRASQDLWRCCNPWPWTHHDTAGRAYPQAL